MSFVSFTFAGFLLLLLALYYLLPKRFQWKLLLIGSLVFYAFAGLKYLLYIAVTILSTWGGCVWMQRLYDAQDEYIKTNKAVLSREERRAYKDSVGKKARLILSACILLNFGILAVIKYSNFFLENVGALLHTSFGRTSFVLPLGISFYMFQSLGYAIDVYRRKYPAQKDLAKSALFTSFFPQLIQGPISRFDQLSKTLFEEHDWDAQNIKDGLWRITWGYFKKLVIADRLAPAVAALTAAPDRYRGVFVLAAILFYALQIYGDFTGGIDIAIGAARLFGVEVTENFNRPFFSKNIADYWRRWHITLGSWFRDYLFYPVSLSKGVKDLSKWCKAHIGEGVGKRLPLYTATIAAWLATGLWHGAAWHFIVWGLANCAVLLISQELTPLYERFHERFAFSNTRCWERFMVFRTFWLMGMIRVLDVYRSGRLTAKMILSIFTTPNWHALLDGSFLKLGLSGADYLVAGIAVLIVWCAALIKGQKPVLTWLYEKPVSLRYLLFWCLVVSIIVFGAYGIGYDASQFIYNQF
ncbi:MAG: MBOAT family protein [Firmicutes bacterium]|nr:MBOAT family protein [Bacillota bacterium]MBQ3578254.1 MBOAT family protein [Bacillota bacterium]MBQ4234296.1 MBOAT family protein [Bacillota bacterium]MBQ6259927.1 MBOAT family protein [Bacillota bacterium]MBR0115383.1 MBOAT family protein [Bacillota bacterium]